MPKLRKDLLLERQPTWLPFLWEGLHHSVLGLHELPMWNMDQLSYFADQRFLVAIQTTICISHLPEHFHHTNFIVSRKMLVDEAGELIQRNGLSSLTLGQTRQLLSFTIAEHEGRLQSALKDVPLFGMLIRIGTQHFEQQRCGRQLQAVLVGASPQIGFNLGTEIVLDGS
jgi:hypothetical protein